MTDALAFSNLMTWTLQIGLLALLAAPGPIMLRLRDPRARLLYWQVGLTACLILPFLRTWQRETIILATHASKPLSVAAVPLPAVPATLPPESVMLYLLALGVCARFGWLLTGFWRMRTFRRRSVPLHPMPAWGAEAHLRISQDVSSPVTFGFLDPVVLLPATFPAMPEAQREAILCHEVMHVRRRDWLFTVAEELIRTALWFHPAIWWILGEIQLAREQAVDREVIGMTHSRDEYVDALLTVAGASPRPDLATASPFLRRRHLKQRVVSIFKEVHMSKTRVVSALAASLVLLAASCWFVTGAIPLYGAPQMVSDAPGVAVETNGARLMHRSAVAYPPEAAEKRIEGSVTVQVKLDNGGNVSDANILSGPEELRKSVLQSVLNWHFAPDAANGTRHVTVSFQLPAQTPVRVVRLPKFVEPLPAEAASTGETRTLKTISVSGLDDQARDALLAQLPVHEGDAFTPGLLGKVAPIVHAFDQHLGVRIGRLSSTEYSLTIFAQETMDRTLAGIMGGVAPPPPPPPPPMESAYKGPAIRVDYANQQAMLISQPKPVYPPLAKAARVQGTVRFETVIGKDGTVQNLHLLSGPPLLAQAAMQAVQQWVYKPTLLNGNPTEVITTIDVNFTLSQ